MSNPTDDTAAELLAALAASTAQNDRLEAAVAALERRNAELEALAARRVAAMVAARTLPAEQRTEELAAVFEASLELERLSGNAQRFHISRRLKLPADRVRGYLRVLSLFTKRKQEGTLEASQERVGPF
jgi:hypothetical protein